MYGKILAAIGAVLMSMAGCAAGSALAPVRAENARPACSALPDRLTGSVDVDLSPAGPWMARLNGLDDSQVRSVVYWIRDAKHRWRALEAVDRAPFDAPVDWWDGDNSGYEAVTAHVTLCSGKTLRDPGGWHWVDGRHASPLGSTRVALNADGSAGATYAPALHGTVIREVDFWLRTADRHWVDAGAATQPGTGTYSVPRLAGSGSGGWNGSDAAVSVHVVWPNGSEFVDPDPWVWSDAFVPAPTASPTAPPPTQRPAAAAPAPPAAAPARPPTAAPASCYPLSNSGTCYRPGEFCRTSDHGATGRTADGEAIVCRYNNGWRWEPA
jgi:hypothetical protein